MLVEIGLEKHPVEERDPFFRFASFIITGYRFVFGVNLGKSDLCLIDFAAHTVVAAVAVGSRIEQPGSGEFPLRDMLLGFVEQILVYKPYNCTDDVALVAGDKFPSVRMELTNVIEEGDDGNNQRDNDGYVGFLIGKPETVDHLVYNKANPEQHCQDK